MKLVVVTKNECKERWENDREETKRGKRKEKGEDMKPKGRGGEGIYSE